MGGFSLLEYKWPFLDFDELALKIAKFKMTMQFAEIIYRLFCKESLNCWEAIAYFDNWHQVMQVQQNGLLELMGEVIVEIAASPQVQS